MNILHMKLKSEEQIRTGDWLCMLVHGWRARRNSLSSIAWIW